MRPRLTAAPLGGIGLLAAALRSDTPRRLRNRYREPRFDLHRHQSRDRRRAAG